MKKLLAFFPILIIIFLFDSCSTKDEVDEFLMEYRYSTVDELAAAIIKIDSICQANEIIAFLDTLPNGLPDPNGEVMSLSIHVGYIYELVVSGQLVDAVYEIYRFNGQPFSLISYLMKAQMAENISLALMGQILAIIPLPPIPVPGFVPPVKPIPAPACLCDNPRVKILVTYTYEPNPGRYTGELSGYAANNTLTNMRTGTWFRFDAEMHDCRCPGGITWTSELIEHPPTNYVCRNPPGPTAGITSLVSGTFKIRFKGVCACNGKEATATFTLTF